MDSSGNYGARLTFSFAGNRYTTKQEACLILNGGNTGGYLETNSGSGTVSIGNIYLSVPTDTTQNLRSIDFISSVTYYTSYRINNGRLFIGDALGTYDGSTAAKRASYVTGLAAFIKQ